VNSDKQLELVQRLLAARKLRRNYQKHINLLGNKFCKNIFRSLEGANSSSMQLSMVQSVA